jgi:hypothetical protein
MNDGLPSGLGAGATVVSGPLQTRRSINETTFIGNIAGRFVVDLSRGTMQLVPLNGNTTIVFPQHRAGAGFTLLIRQDSVGSRTVTWPSNVAWGGGTAPTITATANKMDVISFVGSPEGGRWLGFVGGLNF